MRRAILTSLLAGTLSEVNALQFSLPGFTLEKTFYEDGGASWTKIRSNQGSSNKVEIFMNNNGQIVPKFNESLGLDARPWFHGMSAVEQQGTGLRFHGLHYGDGEFLPFDDFNLYQVNQDQTISVKGYTEKGCLAAGEMYLVLAQNNCLRFDVSRKAYCDFIFYDGGCDYDVYDVEDDTPKGPSYTKCHKAPEANQYFCHSSESCEFTSETFRSAEDGINLSGCASAGVGAEGEACAGYSNTEIEQKTQTKTITIGAGKFVCGVYMGNYQDDQWIFSFNYFFGEIDSGTNTCIKLIQKEIPNYSEYFCKSTASSGHFGLKGVGLSLVSLILAATLV